MLSEFFLSIQIIFRNVICYFVFSFTLIFAVTSSPSTPSPLVPAEIKSPAELYRIAKDKPSIFGSIINGSSNKLTLEIAAKSVKCYILRIE